MYKRIGLTLTQIKIIALIMMVLDHLYHFFKFTGYFPIYFKWFGRLAFPLFIFASCEGYFHSTNKVKYLARLFVFFIFMTFGNYYLNTFYPRGDGFVLRTNIFGSIFLMVFIIYCLDHVKFGKEYFIFVAAALFFGLYVEGGILFILLGVAMYYFRFFRPVQVLIYVTLSLLFFLDKNFTIRTVQYYLYANYQWMMVFATFIMILYNGEKGSGKKYLFYVFYPFHIYIFYIMSTILIKKWFT